MPLISELRLSVAPRQYVTAGPCRRVTGGRGASGAGSPPALAGSRRVRPNANGRVRPHIG